MFAVGLVPAIILIPLRFFMKESPRWLASKGRYAEADAIVRQLEASAEARGVTLTEPKIIPVKATGKSTDWRELFQGVEEPGHHRTHADKDP